MGHHEWTAREVAVLRKTYPAGGSPAAMAALPSRTRNSVLRKAGSLGLATTYMAHRAWTTTELGALRRWYSHGYKAVMRRVPGRTKTSIIAMASRIGVASGLQDTRKLCSGDVFGRLTVIEAVSSTRYRCQCTCGSARTPRGCDLRSGRVASCGCARRESLARVAKALWSQESRRKKRASMRSAAHVMFRQYKNSALKRGLSFGLSFELFLRLTAMPCHYCGSPPARRVSGYPAFAFSGIDRMHNTTGYVEGNVQPCCRTCNFGKGSLSYSEYVAWLDRLVAHRLSMPILSA